MYAPLCAALLLLVNPAASEAVTNVMSPSVTWDPYNEAREIPAARRLKPAELTLARQRAAAMFEAMKVAPSFNAPADRATMLVSSARLEAPTILNQKFIAYWSVPRDVRRGKDGTLVPALGGSHQLLYFETNLTPADDQLEDRATRGNFGRAAVNGRSGGYFAAPRMFGRLGEGEVFADMIVLTRDGRSALEPAPIGALLDLEIARLSDAAKAIEQGFANRLRELEETMTPTAVSERRAKRERAWRSETRDATALAKRLDDAAKTDETDYQRQRQYFATDAPRDASNTVWRPRLALEAAQAKRASLGEAGYGSPACGRVEPGFDSQTEVRYDVAGAASNCVPMVRVRQDLVDPTRPVDEVQLLTVWFRGDACGENLEGKTFATGSRCAYAVPLLREMSWDRARRAIGW